MLALHLPVPLPNTMKDPEPDLGAASCFPSAGLPLVVAIHLRASCPSSPIGIALCRWGVTGDRVWLRHLPVNPNPRLTSHLGHQNRVADRAAPQTRRAVCWRQAERYIKLPNSGRRHPLFSTGLLYVWRFTPVSPHSGHVPHSGVSFEAERYVVAASAIIRTSFALHRRNPVLAIAIRGCSCVTRIQIGHPIQQGHSIALLVSLSRL
ncbi:hypothetical protein BKA81DRAFT_114369 [Phyllosticta paracitricarpa]